MVANYHTLVVHFPVALLGLYTILEILRTKLKGNFWIQIRRFLLYIGTFTAAVAIFVAGFIEIEYLAKFPKIFPVHELYAMLTFWIYLILTIVYLIEQFKKNLMKNKYFKKYEKHFDEIIELVYHSHFTYFFVGIGFIFLSITGALGGAMVSGPTVDPFVAFFYNLLIK